MTPLGRWRGFTLAAVALAVQAAPAHAQATVTGKVELPKALHAPVLNKRYGIVSYNGVLSPYPPLAVIYLEGAFRRAENPPGARMVQKDLNFQPAILPIQAGTRVEFPNLDDTYHNIFSYSPAKRFDLGRYRSDERPIPSVLFDVAGMVTVRCDIHEHMRAIILVLDTPHFVMSDASGAYRLDGLPLGHFVLKVWLDSKTTLERPVDLQAGTTLRADFP
jgi:plastocyanin